MKNYKVLLIESNYTTAMHLREMIPWEDLGYSLVTEYYELTATSKLCAIQPDILIVGNIQNLSSIQQYIDIIHDRHLKTRVIILINTETPWRALSNGNVDSFLSLSSMTKDELIRALEHALTDVTSYVPAFEWKKWTKQNVPDLLSRLTERHSGWYLIAAYLPDSSEEKLINYDKLSRLLQSIFQERIYLIAADKNRFLTALENPAVQYDETRLTNICASIRDAAGQCSGNRKATLFMSYISDSTNILSAYNKLLENSGYYYFISDMSVVTALPQPTLCTEEDIAESSNKLFAHALKTESSLAVNIINELYMQKIGPSLDRRILAYGRACIERTFSILEFLWQTDMHLDFYDSETATIQREAEYVSSVLSAGISRSKDQARIRPRILEALVFLINNHSQDVSLITVADFLGVNTSYLSRIFKEDIGIGISDCLNKLRIADAKCFFHSGYQNIGQIAEKSGFWNIKYFSKLFKSYEGVTPSEYLKSLRRQRCIKTLCETKINEK